MPSEPVFRNSLKVRTEPQKFNFRSLVNVFNWGQWVGVGLKKLHVVAKTNILIYFLFFFVLGISSSYCMWELLDLSLNVLKIVAFNCINHVCIGGILHLL